MPIKLGGRIPNPDLGYNPRAVKIYTDAAGRGIGSVIFPDTWSQIKHGTATNSGKPAADGKSLACKLSVWELTGPLLAITSAPEKVRNKNAVAYIDNIGSVLWWQKGWAKGCNLGNTIIRALYLVTKSLNCELFIDHVSRC